MQLTPEAPVSKIFPDVTATIVDTGVFESMRKMLYGGGVQCDDLSQYPIKAAQSGSALVTSDYAPLTLESVFPWRNAHACVSQNRSR